MRPEHRSCWKPHSGHSGKLGLCGIAWKHPATGLSVAVEGRYIENAIFTDDLNGLKTSSETVANFSVGLEQTTTQWRFEEYLRVDNVADSDYVGSVIVNESNQRYFEPAPGRTWLLGFQGFGQALRQGGSSIPRRQPDSS